MPKAMILAAGLGTRLMPLTANLPKALVEIAGKSMITHVIEKLAYFGFREIIVNVHHFAEQLKDFLKDLSSENYVITISDESGKLLDTGGGLQKAAWFFDDQQPFLVHNCDVISQLPLNEMFEFHKKNAAMATLAVSKRSTSRPLAFNENGQLLGRFKDGAETASWPLAFSGISVFDTGIFNFMPDAEEFSIIDVLIKASASEKIIAFEHSPEIWTDAGSIKNLEKAEHLLKYSHL
jgi:NDP-sugar pyrophosphorylase family protein